MEEIKIRSHSLCRGDRIAVIAEKSKADILAKAKALAADASVKAVEWRIDEFEDVFEIRFELMPAAIAQVREALGDKLMMYTFRDSRIGGAHPTTCMYHSRLNSLAINSGAGDMITVEWCDEPDAARSNVENAHAGNKAVVASWCTVSPFSADGVEKKLKQMLESKAELLEFGALCAGDGDKAKLTAGIEAFKVANPDVPVIASYKSRCGCEEKIIF